MPGWPRTTTVATALPVRIEYAGGHRIAVETESIMKREATLNSVTSVSAILLLLLVVFRSAWLFLVGAIPMSVATLGAIAINGLLRDQLSAAATGTSALLFGLGIDGLVLMYARYLEEIESGRRRSGRGIARLGGAGTSMLLGCLTTAATFFGLTWIDLPGLQELGRLVGVGMLLGGPLTLLLVAALLPARVKRPRGAVSGIARAVRAPASVGHSRRRRSRDRRRGAARDEVRSRCPARSDCNRPRPPSGSSRRSDERFGVDRDVALALAQGPSLDALIASSRQFDTAVTGCGAGACGSPVPSRLLPPIDEQAETGRILDDRGHRPPCDSGAIARRRCGPRVSTRRLRRVSSKGCRACSILSSG